MWKRGHFEREYKGKDRGLGAANLHLEKYWDADISGLIGSLKECLGELATFDIQEPYFTLRITRLT